MRDLQERRLVFEALTAPPKPARKIPGRRAGWIAGVVAAVVAADQLTKSAALGQLVPYQPEHVVGPLWWELTFNSGAAFSLGRGVTPIVESIVVVLVVGLVAFGRRAAKDATALTVIGIGLLLGGAASNLADRLVRHNRGAVVDFIDLLRFGRRDLWPVFNLADAAIVLGAAALVLNSSRGQHRTTPSGPPVNDAAGALSTTAAPAADTRTGEADHA